MVEMLVIGGIVGVLAGVIASLVALKIQQHSLDGTQAQQQAWERAQDDRQRQWGVQQEKCTLQLEKKLTEQVQQLQMEWQAWQAKDITRAETLVRQYEVTTMQLRVEYALARLPRVEEIPLPLDSKSRPSTSDTESQPLLLQGTDLSHYDLSHRYLSGANLRGVRLVNANLSMTDLSTACLADADLSGANLSAANLTNADLRGATLSGANFLVADLNNAILIGANLLDAHSLTTLQLGSAIYDSTTLLDPEMDITLPRTPRISEPAPSSQASSPLEEKTRSEEASPLTQQSMGDLESHGSPASSPLSLDDSQLASGEANPPENTRTAELDTDLPRERYNGKTRARVD